MYKNGEKKYKSYQFCMQKRTPYPHLLILIISIFFYIMSTLLTVPPNLAEIRQQLFHAAEPIFMNETQ
jgi:hypothetical protein